jgi:hypothetical protein
MVASHEPHVVCLTEAYEDLLDGFGHMVWSEADYGYPILPGRRKVLLASGQPWRAVDTTGDPSLPSGRFVAGVTDTPLGPLRVYGICVPWSRAHVSDGRRDRAPWQDHAAYLAGLTTLLRKCGDGTPMLLVGDYNQRVPRKWAPKAIHDTLLATLGPGLRLATGGEIAGLGKPLIDHVAHSTDLACTSVVGIPRERDGREFSDHDGVVVKLAKAEGS